MCIFFLPWPFFYHSKANILNKIKALTFLSLIRQSAVRHKGISFLTRRGRETPAIKWKQWSKEVQQFMFKNVKNFCVLSTAAHKHTQFWWRSADLLYLCAPGLVGWAALQVFQDAGEWVDLCIQTGAPLFQSLLRSFNLEESIKDSGYSEYPHRFTFYTLCSDTFSKRFLCPLHL